MARPYPADILAALDKIYTHRENMAQKEQNMELAMLKMQHQDDVREDRQAFQLEMNRENWNRTFISEHPNATMNKDTGYYETGAGYDYTQDPSYKLGRLHHVDGKLDEANLSTEGTPEEKQERLDVYRQARNKGSVMMAPNISADIADRVGGDVSPGVLTSQDVADFRQHIKGAGGADSPIVLSQLVDAGIISPSIITRDDQSGLYVANEKAKGLIDVALQGLSKGVISNENYKTTQEYEDYSWKQRQEKMAYAQDLTGHVYVTQSTNIYNDSKRNIGAVKVNWQILGEETTALWNGERAAIHDILQSVGKERGVFTSTEEKNQFLSYLEGVLTIGPDGSGLDNLMEFTTDSNLKILGQFNKSLALSLKNAKFHFDRMDKVAALSSSFMDPPEIAGEESPLRILLQKSGLSVKFQELRSLEVQGKKDTDEYNKLDAEVEAIVSETTRTVKESGNESLIGELSRWLELEGITADMFKEQAAKRRKK